MSAENQITIPDSFRDIYLDPVRHKLQIGKDELLARYEHCEDLANMLMQPALDRKFSLDISELVVLRQIRSGLLGENAVVTEDEATWVVSRLAELLLWVMPPEGWFKS